MIIKVKPFGGVLLNCTLLENVAHKGKKDDAFSKESYSLVEKIRARTPITLASGRPSEGTMDSPGTALWTMISSAQP